MLDDIQVSRKSATDLKPASYAFTIGAKGRVRRTAVGWQAFYTQVANLTYRNEDDLQVPLYHLLGTGRNFADYDQATLKLSVLARPQLLLEPELTVLRQGEGDPRLSHPLVGSYPSTATLFQGIVERTVRLAVGGRWHGGAVELSGSGGVHLTPSAPVTATVRRLLAALGDEDSGPRYRIDGSAGVAAATYPLRDPLEIGRGAPPRAPGADRGFVNGGLALQVRLGALVAVTQPYFDTRLKYDPEYFGKKDRVIAGRNAAAYLDARWRYAELFFGSLSRNWGPPQLGSLLVSPSAYSYDHLHLVVGTPRLQLQALLTQLDDLTDSAGTVNHRYFIAHRLLARPGDHTSLALWEGEVAAGPGRTLEPWFANVLNLGLLVEYDQNVQVNSLLGADLETQLAGLTVFGQVLIDDVQIDRRTQADSEPPSYGLTLGAQGAVCGVSWTAYYTRVTNLTYRTPNPVETVERRFVGLGRGFSDYDQATLTASVIAAPGLLVSPEVTLLRQGEGDFRRPYPPISAYGTTATILSGVVERTLRAAVSGSYAHGAHLGLKFDAAVHRVSNERHVTGRTGTKFVGSVAVTYRFSTQGGLP